MIVFSFVGAATCDLPDSKIGTRQPENLTFVEIHSIKKKDYHFSMIVFSFVGAAACDLPDSKIGTRHPENLTFVEIHSIKKRLPLFYDSLFNCRGSIPQWAEEPATFPILKSGRANRKT
jgi:hypothetical protein